MFLIGETIDGTVGENRRPEALPSLIGVPASERGPIRLKPAYEADIYLTFFASLVFDKGYWRRPLKFCGYCSLRTSFQREISRARFT